MLIRNLIIIFTLFVTANFACAGSYEDALKKNDNVFLYFYINDCRTCKTFDQIYNSIKKQNTDYAYVKVNANTLYGAQLISKFRGRYVPFIILTNSKSGKSVNVNHTCVMDEVCLIRALKSFKG